MIYTATLTQKGQVTIPALIRRDLGLLPYEKVVFEIQDDQVVVKKASKFINLRGSLKSKKKFDDRAADKAVMGYVAKGYEKKLANTGY